MSWLGQIRIKQMMPCSVQSRFTMVPTEDYLKNGLMSWTKPAESAAETSEPKSSRNPQELERFER